MAKRKTPEDFYKRFKELSKGEYILYSNYKSNTEKLCIRHIKCGKVFFMTPKRFLEGHRCPFCNPLKQKNFLEMSKRIDRERPDLSLMTYNGTMKPALFLCRKCNHLFEARPNNVLNSNKQCPYCKPGKMNQEKFLLQLKENTNYILLENFKSLKQKQKFFHKECKNAVIAKSEDILQGTYKCPYCTEREITEKIKNIFINNNYRFKEIDDIPIFFESYKIAIRVLGLQHFENIFKKEQLEEIKLNDSAIREVCKDEKIKLLEIPVWEDYEKIINELLKIIKKSVSYSSFLEWRRSLNIKSYQTYKTGKRKN